MEIDLTTVLVVLVPTLATLYIRHMDKEYAKKNEKAHKKIGKRIKKVEERLVEKLDDLFYDE